MDARDLPELPDDQLREIIHTLRKLIFPQPGLPSREQQDSLHFLASARIELRRRTTATRLGALRQFFRP